MSEKPERYIEKKLKGNKSIVDRKKKENGSKDIQDGEDAGNLIAAIIFTSTTVSRFYI